MVRRRSLPVFVAAILVALTITAALEGARTDRRSAAASRARILSQSSQATVALGSQLEGRITDLAGLFNASTEVDRSEFSAFTEPMLNASGATSLAWVQFVPRDERAAFERNLGVPITHLDGAGRGITAAPRSRYAVTTFIKTADDNEALLGVDVLPDPAAAAAMSRAEQTASPQSTGRVMVGATEPGFVMFIPVYGKNAGPTAARKPTGFVSASFEFGTLRDLLIPLVPSGADAELTIDRAPAVQLGRLHGGVDRANVLVAGQRWEVAVSAAPVEAAVLGLSHSESAAIFLTLLTLLITGLTRQAVVAAGRSEELAALRRHERDQAIGQREASERATRELLAHLPDLAVLRFDASGRFVSATGGLLARAGWDPQELEGQLADDVFDFVTGGVLTDAIQRALAGETSAFPYDGVRGTGMRYWLQALPLAGDQPEGLLVFSNVTALMGAEAARESAERRFERAFENAPVGMALLTRDGAFIQVNEAMCAITGYSAADLAKRKAADIPHPSDLAEVRRRMVALASGSDEDMSLEHRCLHADGHEYWVALHVTLLPDADGAPDLVLAQLLDITDRRLFDQRLRHLADHDPLTGLQNRRSFEQRLDELLVARGRGATVGALLMVDLDHFKAVNDTLGHQAGDRILSDAAAIFTNSLRGEDSVGRLGGDEFAILLPRADEAEARFVATKLGDQIRAAGRGDGRSEPSVTASIGIALLSPDLRSVDQALAAADRAMYTAKGAGRDRYALAAAKPAPTGPARV